MKETNLEIEVQILKEKVEFLKSNIEWLVEAHGNSETTEYTGDGSPWKLKDYVKEQMEEFNKIGILENMIINTKNQRLQVLNNDHIDFNKLLCFIDCSLDEGCKHTYENFYKACKALETLMGYEIDKVYTLEWMKKNGGYCDCEILMNTQIF